MARPLRIDIPNGLYHVTSRGLERLATVRDDADRGRWTDLLDVVATRRRWRVLAWALMDNHSHLFVRTPDADLSAGMHDLNGSYATGFNRRHGRVGPLLQGRFKAILVETGRHEWELSRYIHLNPVRAGLAGDFESYRWSSCRCYFRASLAPEWLAWEEVLSLHGRTVRTARRAYRAFLEAGLRAGLDSPLRGAVASTLLGSAGFVERMRAWLEGKLPDREVPAARTLRAAATVEAVEAAVCHVFGVASERLWERGRWHNDARLVALYLCRKHTGATISRLGERFGGVTGQAVSRAAHELAARLATERPLSRRVSRCEQALACEAEK